MRNGADYVAGRPPRFDVPMMLIIGIERLYRSSCLRIASATKLSSF